MTTLEVFCVTSLASQTESMLFQNKFQKSILKLIQKN